MNDFAITLTGVSKKYPIYETPFQRLQEAVLRGRKKYHREFWALRDVDLRVPAGVTLGILGHNGAGKTTILQLMAGILAPTSGEVFTRGQISTILELGAGFNPEFTGRENAYLSGIIIGLSPAQIREKMAEIIAFAEIGEFIDQPVKTYSSGMYVRLAFAVAVVLDPDILLIDEILAVGDAYFQHKCIRRIRDLQARGRTLVYVTHDIESVRNLCHRAMIIEHSRILVHGEPGEIADQYMALTDNRDREGVTAFDQEGKSQAPADYSRYGTGEAEIFRVEILNAEGEPSTNFRVGEEFLLKFHVEFKADVDKFALGNIFRNKWGLDIFGTNTYWENLVRQNFRKGESCVVTFRHRADFADGTYSINPAASAVIGQDAYRTLDWINNAAIIRVWNPRRMSGCVKLFTRIEVEKK